MGRGDSRPEPRDTGRMGFRRDWEPVDERPLLVEYACQCRGCREWEGPYRDQTERMTYEDAVEANPKGPDEGPAAYFIRLSELVTKKYAGVKSMPHVRQSRRERDQALARLRGQAAAQGLPTNTEDYA